MTTTTQFEHTTLVFQFEEKSFATRRDNLLQGLTPDTASELERLGRDRWELVAVLPYVSPAVRVLRQPGTDAAVGFFKRAKE